jgi:hypothetical protein
MRSLHLTASSVELIVASSGRQCRYFVTEYQNVEFSISLLVLKIEMLGLLGYESGAIVHYPSCLILTDHSFSVNSPPAKGCQMSPPAADL